MRVRVEPQTKVLTAHISFTPLMPEMTRSFCLRYSLTLGVVVRIRSCSISDVTMLRNIAHRWALSRPSFRYGMASTCDPPGWRGAVR
jgi:hypothetical protein